MFEWRRAAAVVVVVALVVVLLGINYFAQSYLQSISIYQRFGSPNLEHGTVLYGFGVSGRPQGPQSRPSFWERFVRFEQVEYFHSALQADDIWVVTNAGIASARPASIDLAAINARPVAGEDFVGGRREILFRLSRQPGKIETASEDGVIVVHLRLLWLRAVVRD